MDPGGKKLHPKLANVSRQVWGWAVAILDVDHDIWSIVDGTTFLARLSCSICGRDFWLRDEEVTLVLLLGGFKYLLFFISVCGNDPI